MVYKNKYSKDLANMSLGRMPIFQKAIIFCKCNSIFVREMNMLILHKYLYLSTHPSLTLTVFYTSALHLKYTFT